MLLLYSSKTLGVAPRKSEKQRRLSRHYFVARKMPSVAWSQAFDIHMRDHFPLLMFSFGLPATGPELEPPAREGIGEDAPFGAIPYDAFRRGIHAVGSSCSTDLRGAAEAHLVQDPVLLQQPVQARSLQLFVGHEAGASLLHSAWRDTKENREAAPAISQVLVAAQLGLGERHLTVGCQPAASSSCILAVFIAASWLRTSVQVCCRRGQNSPQHRSILFPTGGELASRGRKVAQGIICFLFAKTEAECARCV